MARGSFAAAPMKMGNATHTSRGLVPPSEEITARTIVSRSIRVTGRGSRAASIMAMPATAAAAVMTSSAT
jgi:hypothetical protein